MLLVHWSWRRFISKTYVKYWLLMFVIRLSAIYNHRAFEFESSFQILVYQLPCKGAA